MKKKKSGKMKWAQEIILYKNERMTFSPISIHIGLPLESRTIQSLCRTLHEEWIFSLIVTQGMIPLRGIKKKKKGKRERKKKKKKWKASHYWFGIIKAISKCNILRDSLQFEVHKAGKCTLLETFAFQNMFYNLFTQPFKYRLCRCLEM